jgi:hypothetical protein
MPAKCQLRLQSPKLTEMEATNDHVVIVYPPAGRDHDHHDGGVDPVHDPDWKGMKPASRSDCPRQIGCLVLAHVLDLLPLQMHAPLEGASQPQALLISISSIIATTSPKNHRPVRAAILMRPSSDPSLRGPTQRLCGSLWGHARESWYRGFCYTQLGQFAPITMPGPDTLGHVRLRCGSRPSGSGQ